MARLQKVEAKVEEQASSMLKLESVIKHQQQVIVDLRAVAASSEGEVKMRLGWS